MNIPETFFSVHEELVLFGLSCAFGALLGVFYDVFRAARVIFPHNSWLVMLEDVAFLCGYAVFLTAFAAVCARGELRFYYAAGNFLGFVVYLCTVGNAVIAALKKLFLVAGKLFSVIFKPFCRLYVFLCKKARLKFVGNPKNLVKSLKNVKTLLRRYFCLLYNNKENKK